MKVIQPDLRAYLQITDVEGGCHSIDPNKASDILRYRQIRTQLFETFQCAVELRSQETITTLIRNKEIGLEMVQNQDYNLLLLAAVWGYHEIMPILLNIHGLDVNLTDRKGLTALYLAVEKSESSRLSRLFEEMQTQDDPKFYNLLEKAYQEALKHTKVVQFLLSAPEIDVNSDGQDDYTPLMLAAEKGDTQIVKLLLASPNIDVTVNNIENKTALCLAAKYEHSSIVQLFVDYYESSASISFQQDIIEALNCAIISRNIPVVKILLTKSGLNIHESGLDGNTPLNMAIIMNELQLVELLLGYSGIDLISCGRPPPLICAQSLGRTEIVDFLQVYLNSLLSLS